MRKIITAEQLGNIGRSRSPWRAVYSLWPQKGRKGVFSHARGEVTMNLRGVIKDVA